ncbi:MAG: hypothetical protein WA891_05310 [Acidobacteriaceae bacterium]|jgi:hypothetical protein
MKSSIRNFALATSLVAITLSAMPTNAAAVTRKAGGSKLIYLQYATAPSASPVDMIMGIVAMAADNFIWFPSAR